MKTSFIVWLASIILISITHKATATPGQSEDEKKNKKTLSPYFFVISDDPSIDQLPLIETNVSICITGVIADVTVSQVYTNKGKNPLEAIYVFTASTSAAVYSMNLHIGKRIISAKIKEKEAAKSEYEKAKTEGKKASLLEQQRPNIFQMNVANIMPGDTVKVQLKYTEILIPENEIYSFVFPTIVGPRYSNNSQLSASADENWISNPYFHEGTAPKSTFKITTTLIAGLPIQDIKCSSHDIQVDFESKNSASIKLKNTEAFSGNKDFILNYRLAGNSIESGVLLYEGDPNEENFFLAMIQPPQRPNPEEIPPREYIFIMDVSGSMYGYPIDISKKLLKNLISRLRPVDKFNVMLFSGNNSIFSPSSVSATESNLNRAIQMIEQQNGGGGTELLPALTKALSLKKEEGCSRTFVIATDGYVTVEKEAFELIKNNLGNANFFTFGIGKSVNRYIIEGMANVGMGESFIATNERDAEKECEKFRQYIESPVLTDVIMKTTGFTTYDVEPQNIPDVLAKRPILIYGKWKGKADGIISISGKTGKEKYYNEFDLKNTKTSKEYQALKYLWARQKIKMLDDYTRLEANEEHKKNITSLGLKYNLLTNYTSFIAIDSMINNQTGKYKTIIQPLSLPDGVSDYAITSENLSYINSMSGVSMSEVACVSYRVPLIERDACSTVVISYPGSDKTISSQTNPSFKDGKRKLKQFIYQNLIFPDSAKNHKIHGVVELEFTVKTDGSIENIRVVKSLGYGCDEEAVRLIKLTDNMWWPGEIFSAKQDMNYRLKIKFKFKNK